MSKQRYGSYGSPQKRKAKRAMIAKVGKCLRCGSTKNLTIDHIVPRKQGGSNAQTNWQVLCRPCNQKKVFEDYPNQPRPKIASLTPLIESKP